MKKFNLKCPLLIFTIFSIHPYSALAESVLPAANGIKYPANLKDWKVIGSSFRNDNNTQRVILGNSIAIKAARTKHKTAWPNGSVLAKLVWKNIQHPNWETAIIPGDFVHAEIMVKDSVAYKTTGGWGYARWKGVDLKPYGEDVSFSQECLNCHKQVKASDYVFTLPATMP